jgi:lipid-A-disaccharide synthase
VKWGLPTTVMGNPALHRLPKGDGARFRDAHGIRRGERIIGLLPGSRPAEIRRVMPKLVEATEQLCKTHPECRVVCMVASAVKDAVHAAAKTWTFPHVLIDEEGEKADTYAAMDVAIACSGTVTTELAAQGAAVIACYRLGWITWALLRGFLLKSKYAVLVNVAAQREIVPELIQTRFSVKNIVDYTEGLLSDSARLAKQREDQFDAIRIMKGQIRPAAVIAAETILKVTQGQK